MKRVTWIRHAKSSWANEGLEDHARPLNDRGLGNAAEMGRRLAARKVHPDLLLSSSALRAMSTAHIIAEALGRDPDSVQCEKRLYLASVAEMLDVLADVPGEVDHVMLFWHNPGITEAVEILLDLPLSNVPTCGVICADFDLDDWSRIGKTQGTEVFYDYPKKPER
jgi:phosphohistidine phosphatase